ncbi:Bromo domain-containing protein [Caenorhabditis elegans]|uniref:Bromo domain-containing protein n=1 Tax=Caenorhabditis elegans TaxID=6239 RepID=A5JYT2_CAEEL|nr:Bromo domain-containing protein [Caenorhabditis elegans]CAN86573.1 Bromo domain-containing protein [Caenorhabditis elegans]|eukprot:NP_001122414.1 SWI/SNF nucleosome remodeling complex component [Caenorhabditis elegans]
MPEGESRRSMVGIPPTRRARGGNTPSTATPVVPRTSARAAKRVKKEEPEEEEDYKNNNSDPEKSEEDESEESGDEMTTPSRKTPGGGAGGRKKKRAPLTDYHLKKKKILARKAARDAEKEKEVEPEVQEEVPKEPTPPPPRKAPSFSSYLPIQLMQDHILRKLVEKDPEQYFAFPVTPSMAPDYRDIIKTPMDLQTIRENIEDGKYASLPAMKEDCELIVSNAFQYNQPNTVFYLAAKRLSNLIAYYFGEQYLRFLFHSLPMANKIPFEIVGIRPLAPVPKERTMNKRKAVVKDGMTSEDCLQVADPKVRERLSAKLPEANNPKNKKMGKLGFLSEKDGTVVLNVVAGDSEDGKLENNAPRRVTIGDIVGPLEEGTPGMIQMADHRLFSQAPVNYLNYGPYSSFAPMYDSTWATMTKEDTDLFLRTYGDKSNASDVMSMRRFVGDCPEFSEIIGSLLDTLTDGEHSKTMKELENAGKEVKEEVDNDEYKNETVLSLIDDVSSISNLGIETGFLNDIRQQVLVPAVESNIENNIPEFMNEVNHMNVQQQLNHSGQKVKDLAHIQEHRLVQQPPPMIINIWLIK